MVCNRSSFCRYSKADHRETMRNRLRLALRIFVSICRVRPTFPTPTSTRCVRRWSLIPIQLRSEHMSSSCRWSLPGVTHSSERQIQRLGSQNISKHSSSSRSSLATSGIICTNMHCCCLGLSESKQCLIASDVSKQTARVGFILRQSRCVWCTDCVRYDLMCGLASVGSLSIRNCQATRRWCKQQNWKRKRDEKRLKGWQRATTLSRGTVAEMICLWVEILGKQPLRGWATAQIDCTLRSMHLPQL